MHRAKSVPVAMTATRRLAVHRVNRQMDLSSGLAGRHNNSIATLAPKQVLNASGLTAQNARRTTPLRGTLFGSGTIDTTKTALP